MTRTSSLVLVLCTSFVLTPWPQARAQGSAAPASSLQSVGEPVRLELGKPIERTLQGGEKHVYAIRAEQGQFIHAIVEQLGIDVALELYAPDGKPLGSMDSPNGNFGLEQISTIAEAPGMYRLEVASGDKTVRAGRYRVRIEPLRAPGDPDRARIAAEPMFSEAAQLQGQGSAGSSRKAIEKYLASLPLWRTAGDRYEEALTLDSIGVVYTVFGENQKALEYFSQALPIRREVGDRCGEAATLTNIGLVYSALGQQQKALDYYNQALPIERAVGDRAMEARTLIDIGWVCSELGEKQKALDYYNQALPLEDAVGDPIGEAATLSQIGLVYSSLGEKQKALDYYNQALQIERAVGNRTYEARTLICIGRVYSELQDKQKALHYFNQALPLMRAVGDRNGEAATLSQIGSVYHNLGEKQKALDYYNQALPIERAVGNRTHEAGTLSNIGWVYSALGEQQKALDYYNQALPLEHAVGDRNGEARTLNNIGRAYFALGENAKALESYGQALSLDRAVRDPLGEARGLLNLMTYWKTQGSPSLAIFFGKQGIDRLQQVRRNIQGLSKEEQETFVTSKADSYRELAGLLLAEGRLPEAEDVLGMLKKQEFKEFTRGETGAASSSVAPLTTGEQQAENILSRALEWQQLAQIPAIDRTEQQKARYEELNKALTVNNVKLTDFWQALQSVLPVREAHETKIESSATQKLLRKLPAGTVVVYTLVLDDKLELVVISRDAMVEKSVAVKREVLSAAVEQLRSAIRDQEQGPALLGPAHRLYEWLVQPIAGELEGARATTVAWSLDGVLRYIPVNVLHDGQHYLIERYTNVVFTPADTLGLEEKPEVATWKALGLGVSKQYRKELDPLPAVPEELRTIVRDQQDQQSHGPLPGRILLDEAFTEQALKEELQQRFPLVHIASHFVVGMTTDDSYLLLGGEKAGDTGGYQLRLSDVETMNGLTFDTTALLSLSACETAMSKGEADGKEVDSLAAIGRQRGAQAVLASLWDVNDASTGRMMAEFYRRWMGTKGITKAEALREAQLELLQGKSSGSKAGSKGGQAVAEKAATTSGQAGNNRIYSHPYYWAPFILMGNWL